MIRLNLVGKTAVLHNFSPYLLSDADRPYRLDPITEVIPREVVTRLMPNLRLLRLVIERKPVPFMPYPKNPEYLLAYCTETLECGHKFDFYPQADKLIARRRNCPECVALPKKKPAQSVRALVRKEAA
jgi:hypothetical protein